MRKNLLFFILIFIVFASCKKANDNDQIPFSISYFKDLKEKETITTIATKEMISLKRHNIGYENGTYWFKLTLHKSEIKYPILFELPQSNIHAIEIYQNDKKLSYTRLNDTNFILLIDEPVLNNKFFLKVLFKNEVFFPLQIKKFDDKQLAIKYTFLKNGLFYGFVIVALILNVFFYFTFREKTFIYYCFFLTSITLGILAHDGLLLLIIPENLSIYTGVTYRFLISFSGFFFGYKYLKVNRFFPKIKSIGYILIFLSSFFYLLFVITHQYFYVAIGDTFSFFVLLFNWILGILVFKKYIYAQFFVIGYSLILFSATLYVLPTAWGLDVYTVSLSSIKLGSVFEIIILTYGITFRVNILQKENKNFRDQIDNFLLQIKKSSSNVNNEKNYNLLKEIEKFNLSKREIEVLSLIYKGLTNQRIANDLHISLNTLKFHIRNIYEKIGLKNKNEVIDFLDKKKIPS